MLSLKSSSLVLHPPVCQSAAPVLHRQGDNPRETASTRAKIKEEAVCVVWEHGEKPTWRLQGETHDGREEEEEKPKIGILETGKLFINLKISLAPGWSGTVGMSLVPPARAFLSFSWKEGGNISLTQDLRTNVHQDTKTSVKMYAQKMGAGKPKKGWSWKRVEESDVCFTRFLGATSPVAHAALTF